MIDKTHEPARSAELRSILGASDWLMAILDDVKAVDPPQWWVGAGVIRDVVWEGRFGKGNVRPRTEDVDVAFFDPDDLSPARDRELELRLSDRNGKIAWDAKNQAAVHHWYAHRFGFAVAQFGSVPEAVATWPEYAVCVAVHLSARGRLEICAPNGLGDLLDGVWRRNPNRVTAEGYQRRLARKQPASRWPGVRIVT